MDRYSEILNWLYQLRGGAIDLRLDRMERALAIFGHPEKQFSSFHIAGTNGKGSVSAILHRILCLSGYRTGLYTSPHLVSFTERIKIGDREILPDEVTELAEEIRDRIEQADILLTYFEFVTVLAFVYFARQHIEVGVIEVGLGGRLDATNLVQPLVSAITTISRDHEAYLGSDLRSIASEKAGIIKPGIPVACGALPDEAIETIRAIADERRAPTYFLGSQFNFALKNDDRFDYNGLQQSFADLSVALRGRHQVANAAVALCALELAQGRLAVDAAAIRDGLRSVQWPGRFEVMCETPTVILDGAHNGEGAKALVEVLGRFKHGRKVKFLFACMEDKDWRLILDTLAAVADEFVFTRVNIPRCADPHGFANYLAGRFPCQVIDDSPAAFRMLANSARADDLIMVAGSLYLLGEVRPTAAEFARSRNALLEADDNH